MHEAIREVLAKDAKAFMILVNISCRHVQAMIEVVKIENPIVRKQQPSLIKRNKESNRLSSPDRAGVSLN